MQASYGNNIGTTSAIVIKLSDSSVHTISNPGVMTLSPKWGPDSDEIFFISNHEGSQDIYTQRISREGEKVGSPTRVTAGMNLHSMDISDDGTRIVASDLSYRQNIYSWPLDVEPYATSVDAVAVTEGDQIIEGLAVSPDGTQIAYD
jgi:Tol biopolymer transport system component